MRSTPNRSRSFQRLAASVRATGGGAAQADAAGGPTLVATVTGDSMTSDGGWHQPAHHGANPDQPRAGTEGPGWRPDPEGRFERRFFDGHTWTARVRSGDAEAIDVHRSRQSTEPWYPDPTGRFDARVFDGRRWTKQVAVGEAVAIDIAGVPQGRHRRPRAAGPPPPGTASERPAGWYRDPRPKTRDGGEFWDPRPDLAERERYWDGFQWTAKVRETGGRKVRAPARLFVSRALIVLVAIAVLVVVVTVWVLVA